MRMAQLENNIENSAQSTAWSEDEFELVPLKQRLQLLLADYRISDSELKLESHVPLIPSSLSAPVAEKNGHCDSQHLQFGCSGEEQMNETVAERQAGDVGELDSQENIPNKCMSSTHTVAIAAAAISEKVDSVGSSSLHKSFFVSNPVTVKVEYADDHVVSSSASCLNGSSLAGVQAGVNFEPEPNIDYLDELEHVVLKERLRRLLASKCLGLTSAALEGSAVSSLANVEIEPPGYDGFQSTNVAALGQMSSGGFVLVKREVQTTDDDAYKDELDHMLLRDRMKLLSSRDDPSLGIDQSSNCMSRTVPSTFKCRDSVETVTEEDAPGHLKVLIDKGVSVDEIKLHGEPESDDALEDSSTNFTELEEVIIKGPAVSSLANIKIEPSGYDEFQSTNVAALGQMSSGSFVLLKREVQTTDDDAYEDELDYMILRDRMKLLSSRDGPRLGIDQSSKCMSKTVPSAFKCRPVASTPSQSFKVNRPRKRRKTVTDSVETAMEEDAPGLLKVLIDKGVSVDEIKLYGEPENGDALEGSSTNFAELEEVITKLFSQRDSLLRLGPFRCTKGEKASYCLECLLSLVEQARYLQFRNWPVEWGWCRDLQSFIFVFERHNRIVLERPEYGYATYFFELADSLPINWQIKRLVTAMKLTSCSRITIIENKALMVGDDLTEGEARVLMDYGWIPNTGLGTMLNYYDRVVHDRRNEKDKSEWRSRIAKLLMDGYNGGTIICAGGIPRKFVEIKLEIN